MREQFTDSYHCWSGVHCGFCRNRESGRDWRLSLGKVFELPPGAPDFECPHGKPWGYVPPPGSIATPTASADRSPAAAGESPGVAALNAELDAWELCDSCDFQDWPSGAARNCRLIPGCSPCTLGSRLRNGGPWPQNCPRAGSALDAAPLSAILGT